jgi:hypothetical protein
MQKMQPKEKKVNNEENNIPSMTKVFQEESDLQNTLPATSKLANLLKKNSTKKSERKERERKRGKRAC